MKKFKFFVLSFLVLLFAISCESDKGGENGEIEQIESSLNFSNPKAILLKSTRSTSKESIKGETELFILFQIDENGNVTTLLEDITVKSAVCFSKGVLIKLSNNNGYCLYLDNTYFKLPNNFDATFKGENENGDLIFSDLSVIRNNSFTVQKIQSSLNYPYVQSISGNFAIVASETVFQILNTVSGERYNVDNCNGPRMVALTQTKALINDCHGNALIDMTSGLRKEASLSMWNQEHLYLKNKQAAVVLSQGAGIQDQDKFGLMYIFSDGISTSICNEGFNPGGSSCMNCGDENKVLFNSGDYLVIKELDKISVVKLGDNSKKVILTGYNVISISVKNSKVYFIAENTFGVKVTGIYKLLDDELEIFETNVTYSKVITLN